jgi:hypothetical protein
MPANGQHRSHGFNAIYKAIQARTSVHVLDLGECTSKNFQFYSDIGCRFQFEHVAELLNPTQQTGTVDWLDTFLQMVPPDQRFDLVMGWDVFNFIPQQDITRFYRKLERHLKPNTLIYMLSYAGLRKPAGPAQFNIENDAHIHVINSEATVTNDTHLSTSLLLKALPKCRTIRSYANASGMINGVSEQILCYDPQGVKPKTVFTSGEKIKTPKVDTTFSSPALDLVRKVSSLNENARVLDLSGRNSLSELELKKQFKEVCSIDVRQVLQRLHTMDAQSQQAYLRTSPLFAFKSKPRFDVILAWDFFNYFNDFQLQAFGEGLANYVQDTTLLFSIQYTGDTLPSQPKQYSVTANGIGVDHPLTQTMKSREHPVLSSLRIQKCLPGFFIRNTFTLQQGMQRGTSEYVLVFKDSNTQAREKAALYEQVMERKRLRETQMEAEQA